MPVSRRRRLSFVSVALLGWGAASLPTFAAEPWPSQPLKMIVGFAPGGGNEILARILAP